MARVTSGHVLVSVRAVGSLPTAFVGSMEKVCRLQHDHAQNRCEIEFRDGRRSAFGVHLFSASELRSCFANHLDIETVRGLDLFHSRFAPDPRWNPVSLGDIDRLCAALAKLEQTYAADPNFIDRATHLLMVASSKGMRTTPNIDNRPLVP
jgi:hypothetical protein